MLLSLAAVAFLVLSPASATGPATQSFSIPADEEKMALPAPLIGEEETVAKPKPGKSHKTSDQLDQADADNGAGDAFDGGTPTETQVDQKTPAVNGDGVKPLSAGRKSPKPKKSAVDAPAPVSSPVGMGLAEARGSSVKSDSESAYDVKSAVFMGVSAGVGGAVAGAVLGGPLGAVIGGLLGAGLGALFGFL
jgi:hypothetical protein